MHIPVRNVQGPFEKFNCRCKDCTASGTKRNKFYKIGVVTAKHVLFNSEEARDARFVLFDEHEDGRGRETISGFESGGDDTEKDFSVVYHFTHDEEMAKKLKKICDEYVTMCKKVGGYSVFDGGEGNYPVILIGHPHGRMKYLTVGTILSTDPKSGQIEYEAPSCPGFSGGFVLDIGWPNEEG